jgi:hypothetical protein
MEHCPMSDDQQSFFRRWRAGIAFVGLALVAMVAVRHVMDFGGDAPIVDPYLTVVNEMSSQSPRVHQLLAQYYAKQQRQTVASRHFPWLCHEIQHLAAEDGVFRTLGCPALFDRYEKP